MGGSRCTSGMSALAIRERLTMSTSYQTSNIIDAKQAFYGSIEIVDPLKQDRTLKVVMKHLFLLSKKVFFHNHYFLDLNA